MAAQDAWKQWQCRGCGAIEVRTKERRTIDPKTNPAIHDLAVRYISSYCGISEKDAKALLLPQDSTIKGLDRTYICRRPYVSFLEKIISIEKKITELSAEQLNIKGSFLQKVQSTGLYQRAKRDLPPIDIPPSPKQPRVEREKAVRSLFSSPKKSPAVRVSSKLYSLLFIWWYCIVYRFLLGTRKNHVTTHYRDQQRE